MTDPTPDDATIHRLDRVYRAAHDAVHMEGHTKATTIITLRALSHEHGIAAILSAIRLGEIPLPDDVPQIAALRARVAELEATAGAYKASVEALQEAMADIGEDGDLWTFEDRHAAARDALDVALAKLTPKETT